MKQTSINISVGTIAKTMTIFALATATAAAGRYDGLVKSLDEFMGSAAAVKRNDTDSFVAMGENGNRFRMDCTGHGDKPHFHLEVPSASGRHSDAPGVAHRNYFKQ